MAFRLRDLDPDGKFIPQLHLQMLADVFPAPAIQAVLQEAHGLRHRQRKLNLEVTLWLVIGMNLYSQVALVHVLDKLSHGLRLLWPADTDRAALLPARSAINYRRKQLGVRPVRRLFRELCRPIATPETRGAWFQGLRLLALDGHLQDVPDTPANAAVFGRTRSARGESAFPQVRCVSLCEVGTHCVVDAHFSPVRVAEDRGAQLLLRSVEAGTLLLWDRGLHSFALCRGVRNREADFLSRLPKTVHPHRQRRLPDGSFLAELRHPCRAEAPLTVRIIDYTLQDPQRAGHGQAYRLVTSLLDPERFPAADLVALYHERWEIELVIDEQDTHQLGQHLPASPLRSQTPRGVIQELYGLLLAHYAVRFLMHGAALRADENPDRLSFTHALITIQDSLSDFEIAAPELLPGLLDRLLRDLAALRLPEREPRVEPRAVRRKVIKWPLKRLEHYRWPQPTRCFGAAIRLLDWDGRAVI